MSNTNANTDPYFHQIHQGVRPINNNTYNTTAVGTTAGPGNIYTVGSGAIQFTDDYTEILDRLKAIEDKLEKLTNKLIVKI
jgi:hypothetical protein